MRVDALNNKINRKIGAAYCISDEADCLGAGMIPIDILPREGQYLKDPASLPGESFIRWQHCARSETVVEWQKK